MDDYKLGLRVAEDAKLHGVKIFENTKVVKITTEGEVHTIGGELFKFDRILNIAGPWSIKLLRNSNIKIKFELDLIKGSHLILEKKCENAFLLEVMKDKRFFFILPWHNNTLIGTTEIKQDLNESVFCSDAEEKYLLSSYLEYFPTEMPKIIGSFSGLRPLI